MKKITFLFLMLFASISYGQSCIMIFEEEGYDDDPTVLTVNASDLDCAAGTINSITIVDAELGSYYFCDDWYSFQLNIDGVISSVCAENLIGMEITDFTTLTITSSDIDDWSDDIYLGLAIQINYIAEEVPNCTTLTGPTSNTENAFNGILTWQASSGAAGYRVSVGTTPGGTDVLDNFEAGNVTTYNIPGTLLLGTEYYVNITPHNSIGDAEGCQEFNFNTLDIQPGNTCEDPIIVDTLPYQTTGNTANFFDTIYEGVPGTNCGVSNSYLNGNDVVYAYTATADGSITIKMTPTATYSGIFVYDSCESIGENCLAGVGSSSATVREISEFPVVDGQTYYILISTWASPQSTAYTLEITEDTCTNATATYAVVNNCEEEPGFLVKVNLTNLGSAESLTISDNQQSVSQAVEEAGIYTFGPYANGTSVVITISNDQDENCSITSAALTQAVCPPSNDTCETAQDLTNLSSPISATTVGASNSNLFACNNAGTQISNIYPDVYYKIDVPNGSLLTIGQTVNAYDSTNVVFYGDCDNRTPIDCFDDADDKKVIWKNETGSDQTVYWIQDGHSGSGSFTLAWTVVACTPSQATYSVVPDCEDSEGFYVNVNITNLGSATSVTITDNQGSPAQVAESTGIVSFGPFVNNTPVIFTVVNDQDSGCTLTSPTLNQLVCPPANDNCINATEIIVDEQFCDGTNNNGNNTAATSSGVPLATCFNSGTNDVWFSFEVPEGTATVNISTEFLGGTLLDTQIALYSGTCDALVEEGCAQDGTVVLSNGYAWNSTISNRSVTVGQTYFVRVSGYSNSNSGSFCLDVSTNQYLSTNEFEKSSLRAYPNPVKDILNLTHTENISKIEVYNLLGQQVAVQSVNYTQGQINLSNLTTGAYIVKVTANNQVETIKIIKQ